MIAYKKICRSKGFYFSNSFSSETSRFFLSFETHSGFNPAGHKHGRVAVNLGSQAPAKRSPALGERYGQTSPPGLSGLAHSTLIGERNATKHTHAHADTRIQTWHMWGGLRSGTPFQSTEPAEHSTTVRETPADTRHRQQTACQIGFLFTL